jgi:hypothetical protein
MTCGASTSKAGCAPKTARCNPLTISDGFSRYLLCFEALARPDGKLSRGAGTGVP